MEQSISLSSVFNITTLIYQHATSTLSIDKIMSKKKKKNTNSEIYTKKNICINLFLLAATTTFLSLVNEAQYLMINRASVRLIQELMSSRFEHPESLLKA